MLVDQKAYSLGQFWGNIATKENDVPLPEDDEDWLGYVPGVRRLWESSEQKGMDDQILFDVPQGTEERPRMHLDDRNELGELLSMAQYARMLRNQTYYQMMARDDPLFLGT